MDTKQYLHRFQNDFYALHCLGMYLKYGMDYPESEDFDLAKHFDPSDFEVFYLHFLKKLARQQSLMKEGILKFITEFPEEVEIDKKFGKIRRVKVKPLKYLICAVDC